MILNSQIINIEKINNPFFSKFQGEYEVPPFSEIKAEHYLPAINEGIIQEDQEIEKISKNEEEANFCNTIEALEFSGQLLYKVSSIFFNLYEAHSDENLQSLMEEISPLLTRQQDKVLMNKALFIRIQKIYNNKENENLSEHQLRLTEKIYERFIFNGANLNAENQELLKKINEELALLSVKFGQNLLHETKHYQLVIDKEEDLKGLSQAIITNAQNEAKAANLHGKWLFTLDNSSIIPFLTNSENRELRNRILKAYCHRANNDNENDNKLIITRILSLRLEKAKLLGFNSYADFAISNRMAKKTENVFELLNKLWLPGIKRAKNEAELLQNKIQESGENFQLEAWDWHFYAEKVRKQLYNLDEEEIRTYFELTNVRDGAFWVANKLFGITFTEMHDIPIYHPEVTVFDVKDSKNNHLGLLYFDFFPRKSKRGGAWCTTFREASVQNNKKIRPLVSIVCNFTKAGSDIPSLLSLDETTTLFHEFGHALHALLCISEYPTLGNVAQDYVELPSQFMENWAITPEILKIYAKHYKTGNYIPDELIKKISNSKLFNEGFAVTEYLAAAMLDMKFHSLTQIPQNFDIIAEEKKILQEIGLIPEILPRYRASYFNHISSESYAAGYYVYIWAQVLDADAFSAFEETGLFNEKTASLFRKYIMEIGSLEDEMQAYMRFRGKKPEIEALLKRRGLKE